MRETAFEAGALGEGAVEEKAFGAEPSGLRRGEASDGASDGVPKLARSRAVRAYDIRGGTGG